MVLVWYWELLRALRYKLIWGSELDLSPPFFIKNRKDLKGESGIWTRASKNIQCVYPCTLPTEPPSTLHCSQEQVRNSKSIAQENETYF